MGIESAVALIESVKDLRVLFIGDAIMDEYHYVTPLGKSPKEHLIVVQHVDADEVFQGGVHAAANHARTFCATVDLRESMSAMRKVRMVDRVYLRKLFEIHYDHPVRPCLTAHGRHWYNVAVVTDFGHGAITDAMIQDLMTWPYIAVNAQTNSSNVGFNLITKYPRADYIVIDEPEARLAAGNRYGSIEDVIHKLVEGRCEKMVVTQGSKGATGYDHGVFTKAPALTQNVVDTMGAGDAFFAVTAPMSKTGSMADLLMIGNAAGALKTQIIGHRESVTKKALIEYMRTHG